MTGRSLWRGRALALAGVVLVAFSLRSAVAALSPILTEIQADFAVPAWVAGLIGTAPPVCFAVFGIVTPALERRFGRERLAAAALVVITLALRGRAVAGHAGIRSSVQGARSWAAFSRRSPAHPCSRSPKGRPRKTTLTTPHRSNLRRPQPMPAMRRRKIPTRIMPRPCR